MIKITRIELYTVLWQQRINRLATRYGIPSSEITQICKKHNIPIPPRGYYVKPKDKRSVKKISVPEYNPMIEIHPHPVQQSPSTTKAASAINREFLVDADLSSPHPIVAAICKIYKHHKKDSDGFADTSPICSNEAIKVSPERLDWALRVMSSLFNALENKGYEVSSETQINRYNSQYSHMKIFVTVFGQKMTLAVGEQRIIVKMPNDGFSNKHFQMTGRLKLKIDGSYESTGCILESSPMDFSDRIEEIILRMEKIATKKNQRDEEWRQRNIRYRYEARLDRLCEKRKEKFEVLKSDEKQRFSELLSQAIAFNESKAIREYIKSVEKMWHSKSKKLTPMQIGWLKKAHALLDRHDPLSPNPPSILDINFNDEIFYKSWGEIEKMIRDKLGEYFTP